jgi:hypothetical protein
VRRLTLLISLGCCLLMGVAAQPASAQQARWAVARAMMGAQRQAQAAHANGAANGTVAAAKQNPNPSTNRSQVRPNAEGAGPESAGGGATGNGQANGGGNARGMAGLPPKWVENLRDKPPAEQERFMQNNERFQNLPPRRQQQIRQNLQKWNNLTPDQKNALRERAQRWQQLSPEDRQKVRNELLPKWQEMTPERRQAVNGKLHTLQGMSAADREKALDDPKFMQGLNPDEQSMVRSLSTLRSSPAAQ